MNRIKIDKNTAKYEYSAMTFGTYYSFFRNLRIKAFVGQIYSEKYAFFDVDYLTSVEHNLLFAWIAIIPVC